MKPLNFSDNDSNDEETLSFLPEPKEERVPKTIGIHNNNKSHKKQRRSRHRQGKSKHNRHKRDYYNDTKRSFCLPWMVKSISFMMIVAGIIILKGYKDHLLFGNHKKSKHHIVTEWNGMKLDDLQHWCLDETTTSCKCASPLTPKPRHGHKTWTEAYKQNLQFVKGFQNNRNSNDSTSSSSQSLDVVFLGDSITEGWRGTSFNQTMTHKQRNKEVFETHFDKSKGADLNGLVLGIAGDKSPNLLWRIQNGELPPSLQSKVYWVLIGTNDFLKDGLKHCSAEVVFMGIQRILHEVLLLKPEATIVVNGILPRAPGTTNGKLYPENGETAAVTRAILDVNTKLQAFCKLHEKVEYFDGSELFIRKNETLGQGVESEYIPKDLMGDYLHPTAEGYSIWAKEIVKTVHSIIDEQ